jgi:hypothetical protein
MEMIPRNDPIDHQQEIAVREQYATALTKQITRKHVMIGALGLAGMAIVLPVAVLAVQAGLALAAAGALGIGGLLVWKRVPLWIQRNENSIREASQQEMNRHLAALKAEARKNPIEQAENNYLLRSNQYQAFKQAMIKINAAVSGLGNKLERNKKEKPGMDFSQETEAYNKMSQFVENRMIRLSDAQRKLQAFHTKIEEAKIKWEFQLEANAAIRAMNAVDQDTKINEILTAVAFDSVQREFDTVFASLEVDAVEISGKNQLEFGPGMMVDVSEIRIPEVSNA